MGSAIDYVALLRGINVGGHKPIKMDAIRTAFAGMGFVEPKTVLASGNVVFETEGASENALRRMIEEQLAARTGQPIGVLIRPIAELEALVAADPFAGAKESADSKLYVTFLGELPKRPIELPHRGPNSEFTILRAGPREVISIGSFAKSAPFLDKVYGKATTTRNWNTVYRIVAAAS